MTAMVRVELPAYLCRLANAPQTFEVMVVSPVTQRTVLDALEVKYPMLAGTLRDQTTYVRRPFIRFFACQQDLSHHSPDDPLPDVVAAGSEPFLIIGAVAGG